MLVVDIETHDPELVKLGAGVYHDKDAYVLGCGVYDTNTRKSRYYFLAAHDKDEATLRRDREQLKNRLATNEDKLLANAIYDLDWLENRYGIKVNGFIHDVQVAEPLLNAYRTSFSLNSLCEYYGVQGKKYEKIDELADRINPKRKDDARRYLAQMPSDVVAEYCLGDLSSTYAVWKKQVPLLREQSLFELYELECNLIRVRLMMRRNGIRIDKEHQLKARDILSKQELSLKHNMFMDYGTFNINSSREIAPFLEMDGITVPKTPTGLPSVTKELLDQFANVSPLCSMLRRTRAINKLRTAFIEKAIDEHICDDGRIHCEFHNLRQDAYGTITGRWSSSNPNLQQVPRNDKELGALARGMFIPDENCWYGHTDYSQIEYRGFAHYARGWVKGDELDVKAEEMRRRFIEDPTTDYHKFVIDLIKLDTGVDTDRPTAKRVNFGSLYYMGVNSLSRKFGMPLEQAQEVYDALFSALPFIESTREQVVNTARLRGYVRTILGRRQRVNFNLAKRRELYTGISQKEIKFYPFFNYLIQGSAADIMKAALWQCYKAGVYDVLKLHLIVHDETGVSIPKTKEGIEAYKEQKRIMETAVTLKVPIVAEADYGKNWGEEYEVPKGKTLWEAMEDDLRNNVYRK